MKKINIIYIRLIALLILFMIIIFTVSCSQNTNSNVSITTVKVEKEEIPIEEFLAANHSNVNSLNEESIKAFDIFGEDIEKYEVFLTGEEHGNAESYELRFELLKYFNQKADVRYYLAEMGYSSAAIINNYLETGNEDFLQLIFSNLKGTAAWNKEGYELWRKVYKYNETLSNSKKIKVVGIDIEHQLDTALIYLHSILPNKSVPNEIQTTVEMFENKNRIKDSETLKSLMLLLQEDMQANDKIYKKYFEENYFDFKFVVDNIMNTIIARESSFNIIREESMYSNFKKIYIHLPNEKYYGQWGRDHIYQRNSYTYYGYVDVFGTYLNNEDSPVKDKVLSIAYMYKDSYRMTWGKTYGRAPFNNIEFNDLDILEKYAETDITIFKLKGDFSPFNNKIYFIKKPKGGVTTDYFQYVLLIKNAKETTPFK